MMCGSDSVGASVELELDSLYSSMMVLCWDVQDGEEYLMFGAW